MIFFLGGVPSVQMIYHCLSRIYFETFLEHLFSLIDSNYDSFGNTQTFVWQQLRVQTVFWCMMPYILKAKKFAEPPFQSKTRPRSLDRSGRWSLVNFPNIYSWTKMKYSWTKIKYSWTEIKYSWTKIKYTWTKIKYSWTKIKYSWTEIKYSWYPLTAAPFEDDY